VARAILGRPDRLRLLSSAGKLLSSRTKDRTAPTDITISSLAEGDETAWRVSLQRSTCFASLAPGMGFEEGVSRERGFNDSTARLTRQIPWLKGITPRTVGARGPYTLNFRRQRKLPKRSGATSFSVHEGNFQTAWAKSSFITKL